MNSNTWSGKQGYKPTESSDSAHDFVGSDLVKTRFSEPEVGAEGQAYNTSFMIGQAKVCYHC